MSWMTDVMMGLMMRRFRNRLGHLVQRENAMDMPAVNLLRVSKW
ncbi:MAG TPA: hypothetical protein VM050_00695 [Patescibacteria group bacterium]|nr:hypothetical protein [Patescibacteria group bacterium]